MRRFHKNTLALLIALCHMGYSHAQTTDDSTPVQAVQTTQPLPEIVVYAESNKSLSNINTLTAQQIANIASSNGNISDYLRTNPHVRFENSDQSAYQRGEIKPENISINGADPNQTAYFVDNVNINNDLGGGELAGFFDGTMATLPQSQGSQGYFFDANMLSRVEVHDHDISASLGGFAGGAVVAKTKQYHGENAVRLNYRTTRDSWAKLNISDSDREKFLNAEPNGNVAEYQPRYEKQFWSASIEQGLTQNIGMVAGFSQRNSRIQQTRWINPQGDKDHADNTRRSDNALLNFNWTASDHQRLEWGLRYSNYRESKFWANNLDSNVLDYHQGLGSTLAWVKTMPRGTITTTIAYDQFKDHRDSNATYLKTTIKDSEEYSLGGMGDSDLVQQNYHLSSEYALNPLQWGTTQHSISLGGIYQWTKYHFTRHQDALGETDLIVDLGFDLDGDGVDDTFTDTSSNEAHQGTVKARYKNIALYAEDLITWKNIEFRPGLRIERDDYLKNTNIAPRFVVHYQPFDHTRLSLGLNRYFGRSFASMKLTEGIFKLDGHDSFRYHDIRSFKTPYADELSLGLNQDFKNIAFKLNYVKRDNKNRIILDKDDNNNRYYRQGNPYKVDTYTLQINNIEPWQWGKSRWQTSLAFDWLDTQRADDVENNRLVVLDGQLMSFEQMKQRINSNTESWITRLGLEMTIPDYHLTWANQLYIKAPIKNYELISDDVDPNVYKTYQYGTHTQWDTRLRWQPNIQRHNVYVQFDVLNLLNQTRKSIGRNGEDLGVYTAGREFWLELGYQF